MKSTGLVLCALAAAGLTLTACNREPEKAEAPAPAAVPVASSGETVLAGVAEPVLIDLPSSSPAHARPFAEKAAAWGILTQWIG